MKQNYVSERGTGFLKGPNLFAEKSACFVVSLTRIFYEVIIGYKVSFYSFKKRNKTAFWLPFFDIINKSLICFICANTIAASRYTMIIKVPGSKSFKGTAR
ncbi:hypothetical protein HDC92_001377 [Pedobacter sp. AK017]|nr:hypothetical protein [Pedobacter sp. AK017]